MRSSAIEEIARSMSERLDKEIVGAWRAGYDYLHVYDNVGQMGTYEDQVPMGGFMVKKGVLPSNTKKAISTGDWVYRYTYELNDEEIREAMERTHWGEE